MNAEDKPRSRRALGSVIVSGGARATRTLGRLLALVCVARFFTVEEAGLFAFLLAVGNAAAIFADLGLTEQLTREIPAAGFGGWALERQALRLRLLLLPSGAALAWFALRLLDSTVALADLGALLFASAVTTGDFLAGLRRARGRYDLEALDTSLPALLPLAISAGAAWARASFPSFQLLLGASAAMVVTLRLLAHLTSLPNDDGASPGFRSVAWSSRWFLLKAVASWSSIEIPLVVLRARASDHALAIYAAALRLAGLMTLPYVVLTFVFMPSLAREAGANRQQLDRSVARLNLLTLLLGQTTYAGAMLAAELMIRGLFGQSYLPALPVFRLLALAMLLLIASPPVSPLIAIGKERSISLLTLGMALLLGAMVLGLAPSRGPAGAALAALVAYGSAKTAVLFLYWQTKLPCVDRRYAATLALLISWMVAYHFAEDRIALAVLGGGFLYSAIAVLTLLRRISLFS